MTSEKPIADDVISHCGSFSGETFSSRRRRNTCTLRQHSVNNVAAQLRQLSIDSVSIDGTFGEVELKNRMNKSFHNVRFIVVMMGGLSVGAVLLLRLNITVAILNMVNQTALFIEEHPNKTIEDFLDAGYSLGGEFDWDNEIQQMIMSWYMVAYTIPQVFTTKLGSVVGARLFVPLALGICVVSTILLPSMAYLGWEYVILMRLVNGVGASPVIPMMISLVENWMPYNQLSLGLSVAQVLCCVVQAMIPLLAGYLSSIHWKWAFYGPGAITVVFIIFWLILVTDRPDDSWLISERELGIICGCPNHIDHLKQNQINNKSTKNMMIDKQSSEKQTQETEDTQPEANWKLVLRQPSFYFFIVVWSFYCCSGGGFTFIMPTYLRQFLRISISENGLYCSIIQLGMILSVLWPHPLLQFLKNKCGLSETSARRSVLLIIILVTTTTWNYVGWFNNYQVLMLFINRVMYGAHDIILTGTLMSNYAKYGISGLVFSMVNTVGNLTTVFGSTFIGWFLDYTGQSETSWAWIYTGLGATQLIIFTIFCTAIRAGPIDLERKKQSKKIDSC